MIQMDTSSGNRRRQPLRSRTVDNLINILSICYDNSSHIVKNRGKGTEKDVSSDIIPKDMLFQEQMPMDETQVVFDSQKGGLCNKLMESAEYDHNLLGEKKDLFDKVNTGYLPTDKEMTTSAPHLPTNTDVEELEVLEDLIDIMPRVDAKSVDKTDSNPKHSIGSETGPANDNNSIRILRESVENKTKRNLVDYSEIGFGSDHVLPLQSNSKINATKNRDLVYPLKESGAQNNKKRPGSCAKEERTNKKLKKSVDSTRRPENLTLLGEQLANAAQEGVDASANKDAAVEKKRKRVLTKERKAKRKIKDRIKRAEKNRKLGVKRLKLQPVIKEKKITYCRHYMMGRCHEGEKCKFSHDTTPLTKSKACCHFARHACMKGDDCPFDHDLSKYPCNNYQTKGSCNRGSDCMFSHEAQPSEAPLNASNESKPEHKPPSNSGSKIVETKSCSVPKFVDVTPKSARPPKGISFLSLEKLPQESREVDKITKTPHVFQVSKENAKTSPVVQDPKEIAKTSPAVQDTSEITKALPVVPRGINFLSFGKKHGMGHSKDGFPFKISNGSEKPRLSDVEGESLKATPMVNVVNVVNEVRVDFPTDGPNSSKKPMPIMSFMSSTSQKALHSTLAFASKFDSGVKSKV